jgi:LemA protein
MTGLYVILGIVALLVVIGIVQYNKLVRLNVGVDEGFAQIEVQLQRRADLIPNLVETVKGYATHEKETFEKVVQARAQATAAQGVTAVAEADGMLTQALRGLLAVAEAYPDLKASANFLSLQEELSGTENRVGFARQYYNDSVRALNESIVSIPGKYFAGPAKVVVRDFYVVDDPGKREVPNVTFN